MQGAKSGTLNVTIIEANLTRDTETFSNMDPFVKLIYNNKKVGQTVVKDGAGKKPKWNQKF
jgi:Ca2+-dependent lipid-binding protein